MTFEQFKAGALADEAEYKATKAKAQAAKAVSDAAQKEYAAAYEAYSRTCWLLSELRDVGVEL